MPKCRKTELQEKKHEKTSNRKKNNSQKNTK